MRLLHNPTDRERHAAHTRLGARCTGDSYVDVMTGKRVHHVDGHYCYDDGLMIAAYGWRARRLILVDPLTHGSTGTLGAQALAHHVAGLPAGHFAYILYAGRTWKIEHYNGRDNGRDTRTAQAGYAAPEDALFALETRVYPVLLPVLPLEARHSTVDSQTIGVEDANGVLIAWIDHDGLYRIAAAFPAPESLNLRAEYPSLDLAVHALTQAIEEYQTSEALSTVPTTREC